MGAGTRNLTHPEAKASGYGFAFAAQSASSWLVSGKAFQITKNKRIPITQGKFLFVDYGIQHGYEIPEGESLELINVSFDCRAIGISPNKKSLFS